MPTIEISNVENEHFTSERGVLLAALRRYANSLSPEQEADGELQIANELRRRISATECRPGGCPHCNEEARREEDEWRAREDGA
jgi:hypothetical protein